MSLSPDLIQSALNLLPAPQRLVIGFSGGLDSTVLLHLAHRWQQQNPVVSILALHVNHQLQTLADEWQRQCEQLCRQWQISFQAEKVCVDKAQASLELAARQARHDAFRRHVRPGDALLLAHHRDDQAETLFQRLLRGSGPLGLGAMATQTHANGLPILRPLLDVDRAQLESYAAEYQLLWVDDPSNQDQRHERNFLRHQILPALRARWPQLNQTLARAARLNREAAGLLAELADLDGAGQCQSGAPLPLDLLTPLSRPRACNLLRRWLALQRASMPSESLLHRLLDELVPAADDAQPCLQWGEQQVRRWQHHLYYLPRLPDSGPAPQPLNCHAIPAAGLAWSGGLILSTNGKGSAFSLSRLQQAPLSLRLRQGGERIKPVGRPTNSLKHWLQVQQIPPWWRDRWPLLYCGDELAGLPGLWVAQGFAPLDETDALTLDWQLPGRV